MTTSPRYTVGPSRPFNDSRGCNSRQSERAGRGDVVGGFGGTPETNTFGHAFLYTDAEGFVDLNTRIVSGPQGWLLERAVAINNAGEIVGEARVAPTLELTRGFKLVPADVTAPVISASSATPKVLWLLDGRLVPVQLSVDVTDNKDPSPRCRVEGVSVSEAESDGELSPRLSLRRAKTASPEPTPANLVDRGS